MIFRLGRLIRRGTKGPGVFFILPCIDTYRMVRQTSSAGLTIPLLIKVDLRVLSFDVPPQEILSRDSVTVSVEAVIYFRISNPVISVRFCNSSSESDYKFR